MTFTPAQLNTASTYLANLDADWAALVADVGPCVFPAVGDREPYEALVRAVAYQQLHPKAGDAILARLLAHYQGMFPAPEQLLTTGFDALRACGFSSRKIETLQAIAAATSNGIVPNRAIAETMCDEDLITRLVTLKGIGRWTVEMMLIFTLARMDVLPVDDYGIIEGYRRLKRLPVAPKRREMQTIGEAWKPYRTVASWYLWRVPR